MLLYSLEIVTAHYTIRVEWLEHELGLAVIYQNQNHSIQSPKISLPSGSPDETIDRLLSRMTERWKCQWKEKKTGRSANDHIKYICKQTSRIGICFPLPFNQICFYIKLFAYKLIFFLPIILEWQTNHRLTIIAGGYWLDLINGFVRIMNRSFVNGEPGACTAI